MKQVINGEGTYSLGKPGKQITDINHEKLVKEPFRDIGRSVSSINIISEK